MHAATQLIIKTKELEVVIPLKNRIMKLDECELLVQTGVWFGTGKKIIQVLSSSYLKWKLTLK